MRGHIKGLIAGIAAFVVLAGSGAALAVAVAPGTSSSGTIAACYLNTSKPGKAVLEHIPGNGTCPHGYKKITWNAQGPKGARGPKGKAGPPGVTHGLTTTSLTPVNFTDHNTFYTVLTSPPAPVNGDYYVSASVTIFVGSSTEVDCHSRVQHGFYQARYSQGAAPGYVTLPVNFVATLKAGNAMTIICEGSKDASAGFDSGTLDAILVDSTVSS